MKATSSVFVPKAAIQPMVCTTNAPTPVKKERLQYVSYYGKVLDLDNKRKMELNKLCMKSEIDKFNAGEAARELKALYKKYRTSCTNYQSMDGSIGVLEKRAQIRWHMSKTTNCNILLECFSKLKDKVVWSMLERVKDLMTFDEDSFIEYMLCNKEMNSWLLVCEQYLTTMKYYENRQMEKMIKIYKRIGEDKAERERLVVEIESHIKEAREDAKEVLQELVTKLQRDYRLKQSVIKEFTIEDIREQTMAIKHRKTFQKAIDLLAISLKDEFPGEVNFVEFKEWEENFLKREDALQLFISEIGWLNRGIEKQRKRGIDSRQYVDYNSLSEGEKNQEVPFLAFEGSTRYRYIRNNDNYKPNNIYGDSNIYASSSDDSDSD